MANSNNETNSLLQLEEDKVILLVEMECLLQAINSGDLDARKGYDAIVNMIKEHQEVPLV